MTDLYYALGLLLGCMTHKKNQEELQERIKRASLDVSVEDVRKLLYELAKTAYLEDR